jgi:hypothetical protein
MQIGEVRIPINYCSDTGIYLRWWYNGWHYWLFTKDYQITLQSENTDVMFQQIFSRISRIELPAGLTAKYSYRVIMEGILSNNIPGFTGLLLAEKVEQYENNKWYEVDITRRDTLIQDITDPCYRLEFEITRKDLSETSTLLLRDIKLYINDILCDIDDDEVIAITKQANDIAEMQDRQGDFSQQFKVRKTREMQDLFELSGEAGIITDFPYEKQECKIVQDGIEMLVYGIVILEKTDDNYYHISVLSGNMNFFKTIENLKLNDLTLATTNHTWNATTQATSNDSELDYVYPLCEPSDDAGMCPLTDSGINVDLYGGWIWCFVKIKAIWDEIFSNAGYICEGDILTEPKFLKLFMPITKLNITKAYTDKYLYSLYWSGSRIVLGFERLNFPGVVLINGDADFETLGTYNCQFTAGYKIKVIVIGNIFDPDPELRLMLGAAQVGTFTVTHGLFQLEYNIDYDATAGNALWIAASSYHYFYYSISITEITDAQIGYSSNVYPHLHLPEMTQQEFIKNICNMFGLIPETTPRDRKIKFWNYLDLYDNISIARDWSDYLSEADNETEFEFGDYAQNNYLRYKDSEDVQKDQGKGTMLIEDETLPVEKDAIELSVSTCDEVLVLTDEPTSRLAMNKYDNKENEYVPNKQLDARIVYISRSGTSPASDKTFRISDAIDGAGVPSGNFYSTTDPQIASSLEVSFSQLIGATGYYFGYPGLSRLLTKTNLRKAKFNLPVYEVAGLKHYIPVYLRQYKAYFYVNKINNYVAGKLCTVELVKL